MYYTTIGFQHRRRQQHVPPPDQEPNSPDQWFRSTTTPDHPSTTKTATTTTTIATIARTNRNRTLPIQPLTLRHILYSDEDEIGFHLAMAPAFFGFYGYFGMLAAWYENVHNNTNHHHHQSSSTNDDKTSTSRPLPIRSVVGASAGAMAAILIAAGITPREAMHFCANITVNQYADFPGLLSLFRGNLFEQLLYDFLISAQVSNGIVSPIRFMEDAPIPVAVTAFDIQTMTTQILVEGSMARAARASATFPGLFQPVGWWNMDRTSRTATNQSSTSQQQQDYLFIDGGVFDVAGTMGFSKTILPHTAKQQRVINLCVGSFLTMPGPEDLPNHPDVISISIIGLPQPGPWAMSNGPIAYDMARNAMRDVLDTPLQRVHSDRSNKKRTTESSKTFDPEQPSSSHYQLVIKV